MRFSLLFLFAILSSNVFSQKKDSIPYDLQKDDYSNLPQKSHRLLNQKSTIDVILTTKKFEKEALCVLDNRIFMIDSEKTKKFIKDSLVLSKVIQDSSTTCPINTIFIFERKGKVPNYY